MSTSTQPIKTLSFRVPLDLRVRLGVVIQKLGTTSQEFCNEAVERHVVQAERKLNETEA